MNVVLRRIFTIAVTGVLLCSGKTTQHALTLQRQQRICECVCEADHQSAVVTPLESRTHSSADLESFFGAGCFAGYCWRSCTNTFNTVGYCYSSKTPGILFPGPVIPCRYHNECNTGWACRLYTLPCHFFPTNVVDWHTADDGQ